MNPFISIASQLRTLTGMPNYRTVKIPYSGPDYIIVTVDEYISTAIEQTVTTLLQQGLQQNS